MDKGKDRLQALKEEAVQGFTAYCGLEPVSLEPGRFVTRVALRDVHLQQDGFVHAGVIATMADHTAGYSAFSLVPPDRRILTVEYKINFLVPASGDYLECRSRVIKPGKTLLVTESEVYGVRRDKETLVAKAMLTMAAVPQDKVPAPDSINFK
jgi:uncharacterized protein (TIGR00369 family)